MPEPLQDPCPKSDLWFPVMTQLARSLTQHQVHAADAVVLVPYAQLIGQARQAWATLQGSASTGPTGCFLPRFESTMNWASAVSGQLGFFSPSGDDLRTDVAFDMLTAASLLQRTGHGSHKEELTSRLMEAAWSLARVAAAQPPHLRAAWGADLAARLVEGLDTPVLAMEGTVGGIALVWAAHSAYTTDRLFQARPALLAVIEGFQSEPLGRALQAHVGVPSMSMPLSRERMAGDPPLLAPSATLHAALNAEEEAEQAAACVLQHLAVGRSPVALIAQDRSLVRRVAAMLAQRGVRMRDETGWKLSTTRAAAGVVALLRACTWDASTDAVLDWLKNAPAWPEASLAGAEAELRRMGIRAWRDVPDVPSAPNAEAPAAFAEITFSQAHIRSLAAPVNALRRQLAQARPLSVWLRDLRLALQTAGQWNPMAEDVAGQQVLEALRLHEGAEQAFDFAPSMTLAALSRWAEQVLEGSSFKPEHPLDEQVVILPLEQLLGRPMAAVVFPGCDELSLPVSPEPGGPWTPSQRELLGLPSRAELASAARSAWDHALQLPHVDVLWRTSAGGERLMPSGFVQTLLLDHNTPLAPDARVTRVVGLAPTLPPQPVGQALPVMRLSASAYDDLRRCPYRFFALRQLRLQPADELESELDKRDFGNWLHSTLSRFHETLKKELNPSSAPDFIGLAALLNVASEQATQALGLSAAEFLPFAAAWPRVRDGYLAWLVDHEATGAQFESSETQRHLLLGQGGLTLIGTIDRVDVVHAPSGVPFRLVIDYKTEPRTTTAERIKSGGEDTQLAFYAALMADDTLTAAYVNLGEKEATKTYDQPAINDMRVGVIESVLSDMSRIADGAVLPALGEGKSCDYCNARGLCRKDFWKK
ncbi:MAG: PD-(D/E)XK nuclease family protein [Polaromonas sp.]|nr:PD-(D/E)XK nuclease family protein [Polaromonas sp.]